MSRSDEPSKPPWRRAASRRDFGSPKGEPKGLHGAPSLWFLSLGEQSKEPAPVAR